MQVVPPQTPPGQGPREGALACGGADGKVPECRREGAAGADGKALRASERLMGRRLRHRWKDIAPALGRASCRWMALSLFVPALPLSLQRAWMALLHLHWVE